MSSRAKGWLFTSAMIASGGFLLAPAVAAVSGISMMPALTNPSYSFYSFSNFTPANADPQLAQAMAAKKSSFGLRGLTFTPRAGLDNASRAITVAVHARPLDISRNLRSAKVEESAKAVSSRTPLAVTPVRYSLGSSVGWKGFAMPTRMAEVDRVMTADLNGKADSKSAKSSRWNGVLEVESAPDISRVSKGLDRSKNVELDVSGSYSITRNLDVRAGVRYKADRDRIELPENQKDGQAVYVGTAFRF